MSYHAKDEKPDDVMEDSGANYAKEMTKLYNILFESNEPEKKKTHFLYNRFISEFLIQIQLADVKNDSFSECDSMKDLF